MNRLIFILIFTNSMMHSQNKTLVWAEEFNGSTLNLDNWNYEKGTGHNYEEQYYTSRQKNIFLENGHLVIVARKENYIGSKYTSARINTFNKRLFKFGRIEINAKLPEGNGTWPAIWMLGENRHRVGYPACGEIDIMEHVGKSPTVVHAAAHYPELDNTKMNASTKDFELPGPSSLSNEFNLYAIEWTEERITYFINDIEFHSFELADAEREGRENIFQKPFYLIINLALGGNWAGEIDASIFPAQFFIDYVRYYDLN